MNKRCDGSQAVLQLVHDVFRFFKHCFCSVIQAILKHIFTIHTCESNWSLTYDCIPGINITTIFLWITFGFDPTIVGANLCRSLMILSVAKWIFALFLKTFAKIHLSFFIHHQMLWNAFFRDILCLKTINFNHIFIRIVFTTFAIPINLYHRFRNSFVPACCCEFTNNITFWTVID